MRFWFVYGTYSKQNYCNYEKEGNTSEEILTYIQKNLYGNDNDLLALQITEINLLTTLLPLIADALNTNPFFKLNKLNLTSFDFTQRDVFQKILFSNRQSPIYYDVRKRSRNMTEEKEHTSIHLISYKIEMEIISLIYPCSLSKMA